MSQAPDTRELAMYDLVAAIGENPGGPLSLSDLDGASIKLELTGEGDAKPWHWIVLLAAGDYAYVTGSCDYSGWD